MCGIAGAVRMGGVTITAEGLARMQHAIEHRGPDDRGCWRAADGDAVFVHTRLAIIDPSAAGHQPMRAADDRFTITYNGEIYNFAELRRSLQQSGVTFRSNSDTEVILRLFEAEGPSFVKRLRGMFAFAIWDRHERSAFLARDRFGIKPLYYYERDGELLFASEVRALLATGRVEPRLDPQATYEYFRSGSVPEPLTLFRGVRAVEPGHYMTWRNGRAESSRYWELSFSRQPFPGDPVAETRRALIDSVAHHFVSDVPVGIFLSGGLDSSALVALASAAGRGRIRTLSLTFPGSPIDEGSDARRTAERFKTEHHEWPINADAARPLLDEFLAAADQPSIDGFNTFTVSKLARRFDTKVVLSGLGGDELFGGYPSFREVPRLAQMARVAHVGGPLSRGIAKMAAAIGGSKASRLGDLLTSRPSLESAYSVFRGIYTKAEARTLTNHYVGGADAVVDTIDPRLAWSDDDPRDAVSRLELLRYMRNQLLRDTDVMSMASAIELRVPFLDPELVATVSRIPASQRLLNGKGLLRQAVPEIPEWVLNQPKRGFMFPIKQWIDQGLNEGLASRPADAPNVTMDTWYRKWSVFAFEQWLSRVKESRDE